MRTLFQAFELSKTYKLFTLFPVGVQGIAMSESVCLSVCLYVRSHASKTTRPYFTKFSVHVTTDCGPILL